MRASGVLERTVLVYGQMNEPPGARWRVGLTALTIAEYFRDHEHQNVLLLMDNVFRFVQAGSEVSGLLGRSPSRVGYQPTLATEVAALQERIASVAGAAITAIEAVYVPADDFTDPGGDRDLQPYGQRDRAVAHDGGRGDVSGGRSARLLVHSARSAGGGRTSITRWPSGSARRSRTIGSCRTSSRCSASRSSARRTACMVARARRLQRFLTQPFTVTEAFTGTAGRSVRLADTLAGCRAILDGEADEWAESSLYMVGDDRRSAAKGARPRPRQLHHEAADLRSDDGGG